MKRRRFDQYEDDEDGFDSRTNKRTINEDKKRRQNKNWTRYWQDNESAYDDNDDFYD